MTTAENVPDMLAALKAGRYPHDFVRALTGPLTTTPGSRRAETLDEMLEHDDGGAAVLALLVVSTRAVLNELARAGGDARRRAIARLAAATPDDLDGYANNPNDLFRPL